MASNNDEQSVLDVIPVGCHFHRRAATLFRIKEADILSKKTLKKIESKRFRSPDGGDRGTKRIDIDQDELCNEKVNEVKREMGNIVHVLGGAQSSQSEIVES